MKYTKFIFLSAVIVVFVIGCSFRTVTNNIKQNTVIGTYKYLKDSVQNPNNKFFEEIKLKENNSFVYKNRIGSFIKTEIKGNWRLSEEKLILSSSSNIKDTITSITCNNQNSGYYFEVTNQKEHKINYIMKINQDEANMLKEQYGSSQIDNIPIIQNIQIITSSGLYSKVINLPLRQGKKDKCYSIKINDSRYFENEEWVIVKEGKIRPKGMNQKLTEYFLYKVKN